MIDTSNLLTVKEASQILGCNVQKIYADIRYNHLHVERVMGRPCVYRDEIYKMREEEDMFNIMFAPMKIFAKKNKVHVNTVRLWIDKGKVDWVKKKGKLYIRKTK